MTLLLIRVRPYLPVHLRGKHKREQLQYLAQIRATRSKKPIEKAATAIVCAAF